MGGDVAKQVLVFLQNSVLHRVAHQLLTFHNAVRYRSFGLQTLIGGHVKTVLYSKTEYTHGQVPLFMQVALAQNASIALRVVHRSVGGIHMDKGVQTLLYVHTCSQREGTAHDDTHFTTVHFVEDFELLLDFHA